jgi:hypothetical protein
MTFRSCDFHRDKEAIRRIWLEIGWLEQDKTEVIDVFVESSRAMVAEINGEAECLVLTTPGLIRYLDQDLPFACVTGVTTSRVARKQGLASRVTAQMIAADAADGALVAGLGMFEQGYYNRLGFGTGGYEHWVRFDPAQINVPVDARVPRRITADDWAMVHAARLTRMRGHGACNLEPAGVTRAEMIWPKNGFGFGYCDDGADTFSHHLWCSTDHISHGPYHVHWMAYQTYEQFMELLALLKNLGDQVALITMHEPPGIQLQDLFVQPFRRRRISEKSEYESGTRASAYWQMRICDLPGCMEQTHLKGDKVHFNLVLHDPIADYLDESAPWRGVGGTYVVALGAHSGAELGQDLSLPTLTASVGAWTRLWLGVRPATSLAVTDDLAGPTELLRALDWMLRLPEPKPDWDF